MIKEIPFSQLSQPDQELLLAANEVANQAHAPYSGTLVGSALRTKSGKIFLGANLEYAAFDSVCAERAAMLSANTAGIKDVKTIALYIKKMHSEHVKPSIPCAKCRVMIMSFQKRVGQVIDIISACPNMKTVYKFTVEDLMP